MKSIIVGFVILISITTTYAQTSCCSVTNCGQTWMKYNLQTTNYRNGDPIPLVTDPNIWKNLTTGAYCYPNGDTANVATYGLLYNWYAVNDPRGLAPHTWHIPSESEWNTFFNCLGGYTPCGGCSYPIAGGKMKEASTANWLAPNFGATNSCGFGGLPGGYRNFQGQFGNLTGWGYWWSTTLKPTDINQAWHFYLSYNSDQISHGHFDKTWGFSVRCIKN